MLTLVWWSCEENKLHYTDFSDFTSNLEQSVYLDIKPNKVLDIFLGIQHNMNYAYVKKCVLNKNITKWDDSNSYEDGSHPFLRLEKYNELSETYIKELKKIVCFVTDCNYTLEQENKKILDKMIMFINKNFPK